jgi:NAD(P)H dehydrogenase (quinone)
MRVVVVVASQTGRTARMAEALAQGAKEAGADVAILRAEEAGESDLAAADAIVLGSPVHMGGIASPMRAFFERLAPAWLRGALTGKLGAAFVTAGDGEGGGAELALISLWANLAEHGILCVPMAHDTPHFHEGGCHWGPVAWTNPRARIPGPTPEHLEAARAHGRTVAECTARWLGR